MLREDVRGLAVGHHVEEVIEFLLVVAVQERQVDAMLTLKMSHGVVLAGAYNLARGLIIATELHGERPLPGRAGGPACEEVEEVQKRNGLFSQSMVGRHQLALGAAVAGCRLFCADSL